MRKASERARLGAGMLRGALVSQNGQEPFLELRRDLYLSQLGRSVDSAPVRIDEGHAGPAAFDVPLDELTRRLGKASVEIVTQEVGDLPTLDR